MLIKGNGDKGASPLPPVYWASNAGRPRRCLACNQVCRGSACFTKTSSFVRSQMRRLLINMFWVLFCFFRFHDRGNSRSGETALTRRQAKFQIKLSSSQLVLSCCALATRSHPWHSWRSRTQGQLKWTWTSNTLTTPETHTFSPAFKTPSTVAVCSVRSTPLNETCWS